MLTILLGLVGAIFGLIIWALFGLGLTELGLLPGFDPLGRSDAPETASTATAIVEWSYPVFILVGALVMPRLLTWMLRSPEEIEAGR